MTWEGRFFEQRRHSVLTVPKKQAHSLTTLSMILAYSGFLFQAHFMNKRIRMPVPWASWIWILFSLFLKNICRLHRVLRASNLNIASGYLFAVYKLRGLSFHGSWQYLIVLHVVCQGVVIVVVSDVVAPTTVLVRRWFSALKVLLTAAYTAN